MGTQSAESTKLGRGKLGSARALWSSRSSEHRRGVGVAAVAEFPRAAPPVPHAWHRQPRPPPARIPARGCRHAWGRGWAHARQGLCWSRAPLSPLRQGRKKPPARDRRGGRDGGLGRAQLVPLLERQQWVLSKGSVIKLGLSARSSRFKSPSVKIFNSLTKYQR